MADPLRPPPERGSGTPDERVHDVVALVREIARRLGYAIAVHGSLVRDIDLIAVPWTDAAVPPQELAEAVRIAVGGVWQEDRHDPYDWRYSGSRPEPKPHGRLAYSIYGVLGTYLDLSVMPQRAPLPEQPSERGRGPICPACGVVGFLAGIGHYEAACDNLACGVFTFDVRLPRPAPLPEEPSEAATRRAVFAEVLARWRDGSTDSMAFDDWLEAEATAPGTHSYRSGAGAERREG